MEQLADETEVASTLCENASLPLVLSLSGVAGI